MALQNDALRLAELDRKIDQFLRERKIEEEFFRALTEYVGLRESLQRKMLEEDVVSIEDARAREVLHKVSSGEGLEADNIVRVLGEVRGDPDLAVFGELDDATIEAWDDLLYSWYGPYEYVRGLAELRPLISEWDASPTVKRLVGKARQCYAFQQYDATIVMCRVLLEASAHDIGGRLGLPRRKVGSDWKHLCKKILSKSELLDRLTNVYDRFSKVAHAEREATPQEALSAFHETLSALEELYERYTAN